MKHDTRKGFDHRAASNNNCTFASVLHGKEN
jgi:hypothetical protein